MLTAKRLREILQSPSIGDDMPVVLVYFGADENELAPMLVARDVETVGISMLGRRSGMIVNAAGVPRVEPVRCLALSTEMHSEGDSL